MTIQGFSAHLPSARQLAQTLLGSLQRATRDPAGGVTRPSYGEGEQVAHTLVAEQACAMGLEVTTDAALNTYMTLPGTDRSLPGVVIGSHLDSVARGGNYDGAAGVVAGLAAIHLLQKIGISPAFDITVMGVRAEESAWFRHSYIGSKAALGLLEPAALDARRIDTQKTLAEHITELEGNPEALASGHAFLRPARIRAYVEVHIEQAPSLVQRKHPLAIGTAIPGNVRYPNITVSGTTAHVGLPHRFRNDALKAAAEFVSEMEALWRAWETQGKPMAFTVGRFHTDIDNDATTKVPGIACFSVDMRAYDENDVRTLDQIAKQIAGNLEKRHGVRFDFGERTTAPVAKTDTAMSDAFTRLAAKAGIPAAPLPSPASHDAAVFAGAGIPIGLILIRNEHGSHNPDEHMELDDLVAGINVLTRWLAE